MRRNDIIMIFDLLNLLVGRKWQQSDYLSKSTKSAHTKDNMDTNLTNLLYHDWGELDFKNWHKTKLRWARQLKRIPTHSEILTAYRDLVEARKIEQNLELEDSLKVRRVRTMSGVAPFAVMMGPFKCPGKCTYCIQEPGMPKSYMSDEPAAARAKGLEFDPYKQVRSRLEQFEITGHNPQKLQVIIIGGTFSAYPKDYASHFIKRIYEACNGHESDSIEQAIESNETALYRIVGMSIETRPDWVTEDEIVFLRNYGVTKVQLGVQSLDEDVLHKVERGHGLDEVARATKLLRNTGFKINYHLMPNLPGATPESDIKGIKLMFEDERFKPDTLKIYPTIVLPYTKLYAQFKNGEYLPWDDETLMKTLAAMKQYVPQYCRIDRLVRDITKKWTMGGTKQTNMRDVVARYMKTNGMKCHCIRCREIKGHKDESEITLKSFEYDANDSKEVFLSYESDRYLHAMLRLRLPHQGDQLDNLFPVLKNSAVVREVQSFGKQIKIDTTSKDSAQHRSFGKNLIVEAERLARANGFKKMAIISGVGVREYYRKLGYELIDTYMVKQIS